MTPTFFGCYFTDIKVHPSNWKNTGKKDAPSLNRPWYFYYRFYDPTVKDKNGKIKPLLVIGKGMNKYKTIDQRREMTQQMIKDELEHLVKEGLNPITLSYMVEQDDEFEGEIDPDTPFITALRKTLDLLTCGKNTKKDIRSVIKGIDKAAVQLRIQDEAICRITRKHIKKLLLRCESIYNFSATRYNLYRGYLSMLYKELVEQEAVSGNPIRDISKKITVKKIKVVLTIEERARIDKHLREVFYEYRMFINLFFHSGGRKTELLQLKPAMVNLERQTYRCIIKKGRQYKEVERTIKDIALPYWNYFLQNCQEHQYIFGTRFKPGVNPIGSDMPTRYWLEYVKAPEEKGGLNIKVDFYALKHLNTTETVDQLDEQAAAAQNAHTTTAMVKSVYDVQQSNRQHERLKKVNNSFA